ncbi:MAG: hypothetical protein PWP52_352 [Bacteroidales bacterium]|nr:hypothetical protein [Bacteroidales bacterium]
MSQDSNSPDNNKLKENINDVINNLDHIKTSMKTIEDELDKLYGNESQRINFRTWDNLRNDIYSSTTRLERSLKDLDRLNNFITQDL